MVPEGPPGTALPSGDQVIGDQTGMVLFIAGFMLEEMGESPQFPFRAPDRHGPVAGMGPALHGEVLPEPLDQAGIHRLGHGPS